MSRILKYLGFTFMVSGLIIIISLRMYGLDMTEGQILINYFPYWIFSLGLFIGGWAIINNVSSGTSANNNMIKTGHTWKEPDFSTCDKCGDKDWMGTACDGEKKTCSYPKCNCPFDMGADNKCLRGYEPKENRIGGGCRQF